MIDTSTRRCHLLSCAHAITQEFVVQKLCIDTTRMSRSEKLAAVLTLGWYWLITRKILKQARHLTYTITNKRFIQKEEVTGKTAILCNRKTKVRRSCCCCCCSALLISDARMRSKRLSLQ
jgi:hypothetical protein